MNALPKTAERRLNETKIELTCRTLVSVTKTLGYDDVACLLLLGTKSADLIYDYVVDIHNTFAKGASVTEKVTELVSKIQLYDFLLTYRKFSCSIKNCSPAVYTGLLWFFNLILELKVGTNVVGFNSTTGEVFVDDEYPTLLEAICLIQIDVVAHMRVAGKFSFKAPAKTADYIMMKYGNDVLEKTVSRVLKEPSSTVLTTAALMQKRFDILREMGSSGVCVVPTLLFVEKYTPQNYLDVMNWERSTVNKDACLSMLQYFGFALEEKNFFESRQKLLSEDGVILELKESFDGFRHLKLSEIHNDAQNEHYLVISFWNQGAVRTIPFSLKTPGSFTYLCLYQVDYTMLSLAFEWLGILDCIKEFFKSADLSDFVSTTCSDVEYFRGILLEILNPLPVSTALDGVCYLKPQHWNYEGTTKFNHKKAKRSGSGDYLYELRKIGAHVRKLHEGQQASIEKRDVARRYCLELKPGYTLVEGYVRNQRVKNLTASEITKSIKCF